VPKGNHQVFNIENLNLSLSRASLANDQDLFSKLRTAYSEPGRYYHNESHVSECLNQFRKYGSLARHSEEVELAIWFHDAVYDTTLSDNEEMSAAWAKEYLNSVRAKPDAVDRIVDMILATKTHIAISEDSELMIDIDLGILGTPQNIFEEYDLAIRKEYHWIPEKDYRKGRAQVLKSFLDREAIYRTVVIRDIYEAQARENLTRKVDELSA
jgi:predicted metal-dependent HD superfamily phosphohydrolase